MILSTNIVGGLWLFMNTTVVDFIYLDWLIRLIIAWSDTILDFSNEMISFFLLDLCAINTVIS